MSLALRGVHPYLQEAIGWITGLVESWGGSASYYSGYRSNADQRELYDFCRSRETSVTKFPQVPCPYPVAVPGCSQHEYGFAVDAGFFGPFPYPKWNDSAQALAKEYWGLSTVAGDPNHFAMYPSNQWVPWVREFGDCRPEPRLSYALWPGSRPPGRIDSYCGIGTFATGLEVTRFGIICTGGLWGNPGIYEGE